MSPRASGLRSFILLLERVALVFLSYTRLIIPIEDFLVQTALSYSEGCVREPRNTLGVVCALIATEIKLHQRCWETFMF